MNCCIKCFESAYLKSIIGTSNHIGTCDYSKTKRINLYNISNLTYFGNILSLYVIDTERGKPIEEQLILDFPKEFLSQHLIEAKAVKQLILDIVDNIIEEEKEDYKDILNSPVQLKYKKNNDNKTTNEELSLSWEKFTKEIKTINRFHLTNKPDLEKLRTLFGYYEHNILKGKKYFRARISDKKGFPKKYMGNPPSLLTKSGRANPEGISYLYLANNIETTLFEVRAGLKDFVSVGTFKLKENITVVNLNSYDVFRLAESELLEDAILHQSFIDKLDEELSKPRRRSDSELDYLPTQYLSELIKSMGCDGIEFRSSLNPEGYNLAIFNPDKFICTNVKVYDVDEIKLVAIPYKQ